MRAPHLAFAIVLVALVAPAAARADKPTARTYFELGNRAYNLGRFDEAVQHFSRAYEAHPSPVFLFNIAQAHRLSDACRKAVFFYRRFLDEDPQTPARAEVEGHLRRLDEQCPKKAAAPRREAGRSDDAVERRPDEAPTADPPSVAPSPALEARLEGGATLLVLGDLDVPAQAVAAVTVGHPVRWSDVELVVGADAKLLPLPYEGTARGTATFVGLGARSDLRYHLSPRFAVRAGVGAGVLLLFGLDAGNPVTVGGAPTDGALSLFQLSVTLGLDVFLTEHLALTLSPASMTWSPRRGDLDPAIARVLRFDFVGGFAVFF